MTRSMSLRSGSNCRKRSEPMASPAGPDRQRQGLHRPLAQQVLHSAGRFAPQIGGGNAGRTVSSILVAVGGTFAYIRWLRHRT